MTSDRIEYEAGGDDEPDDYLDMLRNDPTVKYGCDCGCGGDFLASLDGYDDAEGDDA